MARRIVVTCVILLFLVGPLQPQDSRAVGLSATASHVLGVDATQCQPADRVQLSYSPSLPTPGQPILLTASASGTDWYSETVDARPAAGGIGQASLALDPAGRPHISYYDGVNGDLEYAYDDGTAWVTSTLDSEGNVGWYNSLAIYAANDRHISYYDFTNGDLGYLWYDGTTWWGVGAPLDTAGRVGLYNSLALDSHGRPHISYYAMATLTDTLKYIYYDGGAWVTSTVNSGGFFAYSSIAMDVADRPHIAYYDQGGRVKYAYHDGTAWQISEPCNDGAGAVDLALDAAGRPHIVYVSKYFVYVCPPFMPCYWEQHPALGYTYDDGSVWQTTRVTTLDSFLDPLCYQGTPSLALDAAGRPAIFFIGAGARLNFYRHNGLFWQGEDLGPAGSTCGVGDISLALNPEGLARVAYSWESAGELVYLRQDLAPASEPVSYTWDLGDGSTAQGAQVTHAYSTTGLYPVVVTATNACGQTAAVRTVVVAGPERAYLPLVGKGY